jgi:predicted GNAT family acetyltransferase
MTEPTTALTIVDNPATGRLEANIDGHIAWVEYLREGDTIYFTHTEVPKELGGRGIGSALARAVLDRARGEGLRVVAHCPFIKAFIQKHPEYA